MTKQEEHVAVATQKEEDSSLAIVSMVLGVVSLTGPGLFLGIPAIVTGTIALKKKMASRGLAITGLVTGIVSTALSLLFCALMVFLIIWGMANPQQLNDSRDWRNNGSSTEEQAAPFEESQT